jgi:hypothetical protein
MCKPVWFNVKRSSMLYLVGRLPGAVVADPSIIVSHGNLTILDRIQDENGVLMIVSYQPMYYKVGGTVVAALWYPNFGGAGWVDLVKDPQTRLLCDQWKNALADKAIRLEAEANNCMAL